jgi:hypothetical protein
MMISAKKKKKDVKQATALLQKKFDAMPAGSPVVFGNKRKQAEELGCLLTPLKLNFNLKFNFRDSTICCSPMVSRSVASTLES